MGSDGQSCRFRLSSRTRIDTRRPLPDMLSLSLFLSLSDSPGVRLRLPLLHAPSHLPLARLLQQQHAATVRRYGRTGGTSIGYHASIRPCPVASPSRAAPTVQEGEKLEGLVVGE